MTAGQPEGVGQQQGREVVCHPHEPGDLVEVANPKGNWFATVRGKYGDGYDLEDANGFVTWVQCTRLRPAPSPTPPARDSGRGEAREAAVLALAQRMATDNGLSTTGWDRAGVEWQDGWLDYARELLALPELDKLLRPPA